MQKLKLFAEDVKIQVSRTRKPYEIWIENLCEDDRGELIDFGYELTPEQIQEVIEPWVVQSLNLCKRALQEKGLSGQAIEKTILVGGSTLFPWLQERVADELGTQIDFSIDPITVVARGAAVFAGTQRLTLDEGSVKVGSYKIALEYEPVGSETNPLVGGRIVAPASTSVLGLSVEIVETRSQWRSGKIRVSNTGTFLTEVNAEKGRKCEFEIALYDSHGSRLPCEPDSFSYTVGMVITSPPLTHTIGVAMANNKLDIFFPKGEPLPARKTNPYHHTAVALRKNAPVGPENIIRIPIVEGESINKADRNRRIGVIEILPTDPRVKRDVPMGSDIEITIEVDTSRTARTKVYIPILDEEFEEVFESNITTKTPDELRHELDSELERLHKLEEKAAQISDQRCQIVLSRLQEEQIVETARRQVSAAIVDSEARAEGDKKLLDLKLAIDSVEDILKWPDLVKEAWNQISETKATIEGDGTESEKEQMQRLEDAIEEAIAEERIEVLRSKIEEVRALGLRVLIRQPGFWVGYLEYLQERRDFMKNQAAAGLLFDQGNKAINSNDLEALKAAVRQLIGLLPEDQREAAEARGSFGGTTILN